MNLENNTCHSEIRSARRYGSVGLAITFAAVAACSGSDRVSGSHGPSEVAPPVAVASIAVTPTPDTLRVGDELVVSAIPKDAGGHQLIDRRVTWTSSDAGIATVSTTNTGQGVVHGLAPGPVTIAATSDGVSGTGVVVVYVPSVSRITLAPRPDTLLTEHHVALFASLFDQAGRPITESHIQWTSSNPSVATVDTTGRVAGVAPGSSVITAAVGGVSATAAVTILLGPTPPSIDGDWTMTISPSPNCRDKFPASSELGDELVRERIYKVHFTQQGADFQVTFNTPTLQVFNPSQNGGTLFGPTITIDLPGDTNYGSFSSWNLVDHLSEVETLQFGGDIAGTVLIPVCAGFASEHITCDATIVATMDGEIDYWDFLQHPTVLTGPTVVCRAKDHVVTFTRTVQLG